MVYTFATVEKNKLYKTSEGLRSAYIATTKKLRKDGFKTLTISASRAGENGFSICEKKEEGVVERHKISYVDTQREKRLVILTLAITFHESFKELI